MQLDLLEELQKEEFLDIAVNHVQSLLDDAGRCDLQIYGVNKLYESDFVVRLSSGELRKICGFRTYNGSVVLRDEGRCTKDYPNLLVVS